MGRINMIDGKPIKSGDPILLIDDKFKRGILAIYKHHHATYGFVTEDLIDAGTGRLEWWQVSEYGTEDCGNGLYGFLIPYKGSINYIGMDEVINALNSEEEITIDIEKSKKWLEEKVSKK